MQEVYRSAASVLLLRAVPAEAGLSWEILLLHKPRKSDAWQLPQGGCEEGETVEQAALRELHEEAGITGVRVLGMGNRVYQYEFPSSFRRFRPDNVKGQRIQFVLATLPQGIDVHVDGKEIDAYLWVTLRELRGRIKRKEYVDVVVALYEQALALL